MGIKYKKILVIKLDHIGDLILSTPVFRCIKEKYKDVILDVLVSQKTKVVVENSPFVNKIYTYESKDFDRKNDRTEKLIAENIKTIANIRDNCYDLCIGLREDLSNIPIQLMCGAKKNISFSTNTSFEVFLDESVENDEKKHSAEINFDLLKLIGVEKPAKVLPELFIKEQDEEWSRQFLNKSGSKDNNIKVGFSIGGGWYLNWWPISNFAQLGKKIKKDFPEIEIIIVGGKAELSLLSEFRRQVDYEFISAVGETSICQLVALFKQMELVVSNDGGPMHMATAAGVPVISLFGPSPNYRFGPLGEENVVISKYLNCSPCPQFVQGELPKCTDNVCMQKITVDEVYTVVKEKLKQLNLKAEKVNMQKL